MPLGGCRLYSLECREGFFSVTGLPRLCTKSLVWMGGGRSRTLKGKIPPPKACASIVTQASEKRCKKSRRSLVRC